MFNLENKVVVVVGGRGYLGRDFCQKLRSQNAIVISADLPAPSKAASKSDYNYQFEDIEQIDIDITSRESIVNVVRDIVTKHGRIDTLIYSVTAKTNNFFVPYTEYSLDNWRTIINVELDGVFLVTQEVGRFMEQEKKGNIILLSSIYGVVGNDQRIYEGSNLSELYADGDSKDKKIYSPAVYPVSKGGIISLTRYLATYWGDKNIRVNCISPGGVYHEGENEEFLKRYSAKVPLGRKAEVSEITGSVVYLASDESSYTTGQNIIIDGGWTAW